ncbi:MAG: hypothetical protein Kow0089_15790 [Desulfobulbaceae bacterium]
MDTLIPLQLFSRAGAILLPVLLAVSGLLGAVAAVNLLRPLRTLQRPMGLLAALTALVFLAGFVLICWFHYQVYLHLPLTLPQELAAYLNRQLMVMNRGAAYGLPLYDPASPPRYLLPLWLENEKYFFWFLCYAWMALVAHHRLDHPRLRGALHLFTALQAVILFAWTDPFAAPLPKFFESLEPWFTMSLSPGQRLGLFMQLYPKMVFYYNAEYMWFHPPLLFLSYACITITFVTSLFMLARREQAVEAMGYDYAKLGFFLLTLGMLLGYPWALKAWGPNWWWDPKICSSIMMWAVYATYLHTRLFANKPFMWYFSSLLGIICFLAMIFTFVSSFFFPGEHTFV